MQKRLNINLTGMLITAQALKLYFKMPSSSEELFGLSYTHPVCLFLDHKKHVRCLVDISPGIPNYTQDFVSPVSNIENFQAEKKLNINNMDYKQIKIGANSDEEYRSITDLLYNNFLMKIKPSGQLWSETFTPPCLQKKF